jgi:hypothetical protein
VLDVLAERRRHGNAERLHASELVPDDLVLGLVVRAIDRRPAARGVIFDGFPRTATQAEALDAEPSGSGGTARRRVLIDVPGEALIDGGYVASAARATPLRSRAALPPRSAPAEARERTIQSSP